MSKTPAAPDKMIICAAVGQFADDVTNKCAKCGAPIQHRPWHDRATCLFVCMSCGMPDALQHGISHCQRTADEVRLALAKGTRQ